MQEMQSRHGRSSRWSRSVAAVAALSLLGLGHSLDAPDGANPDRATDVPGQVPGAEMAVGSLASFMSHLPESAGDDVVAASDSADRLRDVAASGHLAPLIAQVHIESGTPRPSPVLPPVTPVTAVPGLADLPVDLQAAIAGLDAAVQTAAELLGPLPVEQVQQVLALEAQGWLDWMDHAHRQLPDRRILEAEPVAPEPLATEGPGEATFPPQLAMADLPPAVLRAVSNAPEAALLLATAVDAYVPALEAAVAAQPPAPGVGVAAEGCDLVDLDGRLCVASEADSHHTADYMLTIDLGGDDVHHNSAGGAPISTSDTEMAPVGLLIDLSGNDVYDPQGPLLGSTPVRDPYHDYMASGFTSLLARVGTGAGVYGGVGLLVDRGGDDAYAAHVDSRGPGTMTASYAQGSGRLGIGVLTDDSGNDTYTATAGDGAGMISVLGQAAAMGPCLGFSPSDNDAPVVATGCDTGTLGLLVDGSGDDNYRIDAGSAEGVLSVDGDPAGAVNPLRFAAGQSQASFASALLVDAGGIDSFELHSAAVGPDADTDPRAGAFAFSWGQAMVFSGLAWLLTGVGDTSYTAAATGQDHTWWLRAEAQGAQDHTTGQAVLSDLAGNDRYVIDVNRSITYEVDDCCYEGWRQVPVVGALTAVGQGYSDGAVGMLHDAVGDDVYELASDSEFHGTVAGHSDTGGSILGVHGWTPETWGQGFSRALAGKGVLLDGTGTDSYAYLERDHATVDVATTGTAPEALVVGQIGGGAQGSAVGTSAATLSTGILIDGHDPNSDPRGNRSQVDRFSAVLDVDYRSAADPLAAFVLDGSYSTASFQGRGHQGYGSLGVFVTLSPAVDVTASPYEPACDAIDDGPRGEGTWVGRCDDDKTVRLGTMDVGIAMPGAALPRTPATTQLTVAPVTDGSSGVARTLATATVHDASGEPVRNRKVHFYLVSDLEGQFGPRGLRRLYVPAGTDDDGVARAVVPIAGLTSVPGVHSDGSDHLWVLAVADAGTTGGGELHGPSYDHATVESS